MKSTRKYKKYFKKISKQSNYDKDQYKILQNINKLTLFNTKTNN